MVGTTADAPIFSYGPGWGSGGDQFEDYIGDGGWHAGEACCMCGGGVITSTTGTTGGITATVSSTKRTTTTTAATTTTVAPTATTTSTITVEQPATPTAAEDLGFTYELTFEGKTCLETDPDCTPLRFSTGKDGKKAVFLVAGAAASLENCSKKCFEYEGCQGIYMFPSNTGARCRGLFDIGTAEGKESTAHDLSYTIQLL
jgi:hypothetical protein